MNADDLYKYLQAVREKEINQMKTKIFTENPPKPEIPQQLLPLDAIVRAARSQIDYANELSLTNAVYGAKSDPFGAFSRTIKSATHYATYQPVDAYTFKAKYTPAMEF